MLERWVSKGLSLVALFSCLCSATVAQMDLDVSVEENNMIGSDPGFVIFGSLAVKKNVKYELAGSDARIFDIDGDTGAITLNTVLDAEGPQIRYNPKLIVHDFDVTNIGTSSLTLTLSVIDVNDNAPTCTNAKLNYRSVKENATHGTPLMTFYCSDDDLNAPNNQLVYSFIPPQTDFSLAGGIISTYRSLDYETTKSYKLKIKVTDNAPGQVTFTFTLVVTVKAVNDIEPRWNHLIPSPDSTYPDTYYVPESTSIRTALFKSNATDGDQDIGNTLTYYIYSAFEEPSGRVAIGVFSIDPYTGQVYTQRPLDADNGVDRYDLVLLVTDGYYLHEQSRGVRIWVINVNDNNPEFTEVPPSVIVIPESSAMARMVVTVLSAEDADDFSTLTYRVEEIILGNSQMGDWKFNSFAKGQLEFDHAIDYDAATDKTYNVLKVVVADQDGKADTATVTVSISPVNEHTPEATFTISSPQDLPENTAVGTSINQVNGADGDKGNDGLLVYSFNTRGDSDAFHIDADTGNIYVQKALDKETKDQHDLVIKIQDSGTTPRNITKSLAIHLTNINDNTPSCTKLYATLDVAEDETVGYVVTPLNFFVCSDADEDTMTYTVLPPESNTFEIIGTDLVLKTAVNYEATKTYLVQIKVADPTLFTTIRVGVTITAVNEDTPVFATNPSFDVDENSPAQTLTTYTASDSDDSPHDIVSYSIFSVSNSGSSLFGIDANTGEISIVGNLDYESFRSWDKKYEIVVKAKDGGNLEGSGTVTVNVLQIDNIPPVCFQTLWSITLDERQSGPGPWYVGHLPRCFDPDRTHLSYSLAQSSPTASFAMNNGAITLTTDDLDYETAKLHVLTITITDSGTPPADTTVVVNVIVNNLNDGEPIFLATIDANTAENEAVGASIATVTAIDPDGTDPTFGDIQYSIISGNDNHQFSIDVSSGEIVLQKALDFETDPSHTLVIQAKEKQAGGTATVSQIVNVIDKNDNSPTCNPNTVFVTVPESSSVDFVIRPLICNDGDASAALTYTITNGDTYFKQDGTNLLLKKELDFEVAQSHDISITVSDGKPAHDFILSGKITVGSVDDGPPVFIDTTYSVDVSESESVGFLVEIVTAADPDSNLDSNGQVVYSFVSSYPDFSLDSANGLITLAKQLDRETSDNYKLLVKASANTESVTATVTITVTDANDNTPIFNPSSYLGSISESEGSGTSVLTVTANDADDPSTNNYGTVTYTLSGTGNTDFNINPTNGEITSAAVMNADTTSSYSLTVTATDSGGSPGAKSSSTSVTISVTKVNQNAPTFQANPYSRTIRDNEFSIGDEILKVIATDSDSGVNGDVTITFAVAQTKFSIAQTNNVASIILAEALDFENGDTLFVFDVQATDGGTPAKVSQTSVTITVDDDNDSPFCTPNVLNIAKVEEQTNIATLSCDDLDVDTTLAFAIVSTTPRSINPQVSASGVVTVPAPLDYETDDSYVIKIKVSDNVAPIKSITVTINLYVNDINDNDPSFTGTPFTININEADTADGTTLLTVLANGNDGPDDTVTYSLTSTTSFDIAKESGKITLKGSAPDRETVGASTTFQVCATDSANPTSRSSCETVTVNIADANDNKPIFNPDIYTATVAENASPGDSVGQVTAVDSDVSSDFKTVSYSITAVNTGTAFSVDNNGVVSVANSLDYEATKSYSLTIQASDSTLTSTVKFDITITSVNEFNPTFTPGTTSISVNENTGLDTSVFQAVATDSDDGLDGTFTYSIDSGPFSIDPTSGDVKVSGVLDRETTTSYTLNIRATDKGTSARVGQLALTIDIDDINDNDPTCSSNPYTTSLAENAGAGTTISTLVCNDADDDPNNINNDLTYTLTSHTTLFEVDNAGLVTVKSGASFDRETLDNYKILIDVKDRPETGKRSFSATIYVIITDVNDNDPSFTTLPTTVNVEESRAIGSPIGSGAATDADIGLNGDLSYSLTGGNTGTTFQIDSVSGAITLLKALDFETQQTFNLEVTAVDKGTVPRSTSSTLVVSVTDENDTPPVCGTSLYSASLAENTVSLPVVTVACTDVDGTITYSITAGDPNNDFEIHSTSGALTSKASANLDFETTPTYTLIVEASDGSQAETTSVRVFVTDVNEDPPVFTPPGPYTKTVSEGDAIDHSIMRLAATDSDTGDTVKVFTITAGNGEAKFYLDASNGDVKVQGPLDRETTPSYSLTVQVADSGGSASSTTLTINLVDVNDNKPTCTVATAAVEVNEGVTSGDLYLPSCSDLDTVASPTMAYSIVSGTHAALALDPATGRLYLNGGSFDYETIPNHDVVIEVSDQGTPTPKTTQLTVRITIKPVNEHDPVFTPASAGPFSVSEDDGIGTSIGKVSATDTDTGLLHGTVRYSIVGGDPLGQFRVHKSNGDLKITRKLDKETTATYTLTVRASDDETGSGSVRTADITTTVNVQDVNDVTPTFNTSIYSTDVFENANFGPAVTLIQLTVSDNDSGVNGQTDITIQSGNEENKFAISGTNLNLIAALNYENTISYDLVLEVADRGTPPLKSTARVFINVLPINERAPLINETDASATISEDVTVGSVVYDANATDIDDGLDGEITFSIDSGVTSGEFFIDPKTGKLVVSSVLDYDEPPNSYAIIIRATDGGGKTSATSTVSLTITLTDVNDNYPQFPSSTIPFNVNENANVNHVVGTVEATDKDSGVNGQVTYAKTGGNGLALFDIDSSSGNLTVIGNIDYETLPIYYLFITATDRGTPALVTNCLVKINVRNMNDNDPVIIPEEFAVLVAENVVNGHSILNFTGKDVDNAIDSFGFTAVNSFFKINASSGELTTKADLDRETDAKHILNIELIDRQTGADATLRTSTATLTILVEDINDNDPIITGTYTTSILEDAPVHELLFKIVASDIDAGENAQLVYSIEAGDPGGQFRIDSEGHVQVDKALDWETTASYILTIKVSDKGIPPREDQRNVTITIIDVNDNNPIFTENPYNMNVEENSNLNDPVGSVVASDIDAGVNAALTYSFDSFSVGTASHFAIDGATGAITVTSTDIDRETQNVYTVRVKVTDAGTPLSRSAYTVVNIAINDLNDNPPIFGSLSYSGTVAENSVLTTSILQVAATDLDIGVNADITYSIDNTTADGNLANDYLEINSTTGEITPKANIDYEFYKVFNFTVVATDGGVDPLTGTANVIVTVTDVNDNRPIFNPTFYNTEIAYNAVCETSLTTVTATDADSGINAQISYSLQSTENVFLSNVNDVTGQISLNSVTSANAIFKYEIRATDAGNPMLTSQTPAILRMDTYVPNDHVVTIRLNLTRTDFEARRALFLTNLKKILQTVHRNAIPRIWCVQEYSGTAQSPGSARRRLLQTSDLVDVNVVVLKDDSTDNIANIGKAKELLTQDQVYAVLASDIQGKPGSALQDAAWNDFNIAQVFQHSDDPDSWFDTIYGKAITAFAGFFGLILTGVLIYAIFVCCKRKALAVRPRRKRSKACISEVSPSPTKNRVTVTERELQSNKGDVLDFENNYLESNKLSPKVSRHPPTSSEPFTFTPARGSRSGVAHTEIMTNVEVH